MKHVNWPLCKYSVVPEQKLHMKTHIFLHIYTRFLQITYGMRKEFPLWTSHNGDVKASLGNVGILQVKIPHSIISHKLMSGFLEWSNSQRLYLFISGHFCSLENLYLSRDLSTEIFSLSSPQQDSGSNGICSFFALPVLWKTQWGSH